jgi:MFS family permease
VRKATEEVEKRADSSAIRDMDAIHQRFFSFTELQRLTWVLFALWLYATMDRQLIALFFTSLSRSFDLNDSQLGLLSGLAFAAGFSLCVIPAGWAADRVQPRLVIGVGIFIWSLATIAAAFSNSFIQLFIARLAVGAGEAVLTPVGFALIAEFTKPLERPRVSSVTAFGKSMGLAASLGLPAILVQSFHFLFANHLAVQQIADWRICFGSTGLLGMLLVPLVLLIPRSKDVGTRSAAESNRDGGVRRFLAREWRIVIPFLYCVSFWGAIGAGLNAWLPTYFARTYGWPVFKIGSILGAINIASGLISTILLGLFATSVNDRAGKDMSMRLLALMTGIVVPLAVCAMIPWSPILSLAGAAILYAYSQGIGVLSPVTVMAMLPAGYRSRLIGVFALFTSMAQFSIGPWIYGAVVDLSGLNGRLFWIPFVGVTIVLSIATGLVTVAVENPHRKKAAELALEATIN